MDLYLLNCIHLKLSPQLVLSRKQIIYTANIISYLPFSIFPLPDSTLPSNINNTSPLLPNILGSHLSTFLLHINYAPAPLSPVSFAPFVLFPCPHSYHLSSLSLSHLMLYFGALFLPLSSISQSLFYLFPLFVPPCSPSSLLSSLISFCFLACSLLVPSLFPTPSCHRSVVTAMVRNNVNTVVDIEKIFVQLNGTQSRLTGENQVSVWID